MSLAKILQVLLLMLIVIGTPFGAARGNEPPRVAVSIPPLHSLVAAVMAGVGEPELLVEGGASPHQTALRPSAARNLARAGIVFWAGPELETFLHRALENLDPEIPVIALLHAPGVARLKPRTDHGHDHGEAAGVDPHFWLDPKNALRVTEVAAETLGKTDPANAAAYRENQARVAARLQALDAELEAALRPLSGRPFLVFHDSYAYLERRYGLGPAEAIAIDPERSPGARRLAELREKIREAQVRCLFREPQFASPIVARLREGTELRIDTLDPLGSDLAPGPGLYEAMMRANAAHLVRCLEGGKES